MRFSAHDALLVRQDTECRLLENIKKCLANKAKCDKEYAVALSAVAAQGQKMDKCEELSESTIGIAWKSLCAQFESRARRLRKGAEALESCTLERLTSLCAERRRAKKGVQDDYARATSRFMQLSDEVTKKQAEYQKYLELYKQMRSKFEEQYFKSPTGRGSKKLEEMRDKYQKVCRKLHLIHNEYVLLLVAAAECEKDLKSVQLPGVMARQRAVQDAFNLSCKDMMLDIVQNTDTITNDCIESQKNVESTIENIPNEEYNGFSEKYSTFPEESQMFTFDCSLVKDTSGKLQANRLTVDNLTVEWLKSKLQELEMNIIENKEKQAALQCDNIFVNGNSKAVNGGSPTANGPKMNGCTTELINGNSPSPDNMVNGETREILELRCIELQWTKQADLLRITLSELGCEEAPVGCPDPATPPSSPSNSPPIDENTGDGSSVASTATLALKRHLASVLPQRKLFKAFGIPFRRKSAPCSPVPSLKLRSQRGGSEGPSSLTNLAVKPKMRAIVKRRLNKTRKPNTLHISDVSDESRVGVFNQRDCEVIDDDSLSTNSSRDGDNNYCVIALQRPLVDEEWFHGVLPREEVVRLLRVDGDFLVRETTRNDECQTVLSVCWGGYKHFIVQTTPEGHFRFEGPAFPSVRELILHQQNSGLPVTGRSGAILRKPVTRERWELNNDDVVLMDKIGRGNFGDVYKAHLKSSKLEVAVKTCRLTLPDEQKRTFLQEGRILKQYDHPNIVRLIGICVQKQPIMIVMELVSGGSLLTFLRTRASSLNLKQLLGMCRDAAAGMRYLESKNCIHRDLAARNCLVGTDHVVKISDFGMSREEEEYIVSGGMKQIPIKWTAPEALNFGKYTSLCDVWSYGILMWEIFAKGDTPYSGFTNSKAREKIDAGYRMPAPEDCPEKMYNLMLKCWQYDPEMRPHFDQIYTVVDELFSET